MIPVNFAYCRPETLAELADACARAGDRSFLFYGGGSEILSMARAGSISPEMVIDLKGLTEFRKIALENGALTLGAAATLAEVAQSNFYPLLSATASRIADHTNQCRITLGGNIAGTIAYREAALPLMLADATVVFWSKGALRRAPFQQAFQRRLMRAPDEAVVAFEVDESFLSMPWAHAKRTRGDKIDYPVVTIAALRAPDGLRFALSGALAYPFRDPALEQIFSDARSSPSARAKEILRRLPEPIPSDALAGADWRAFQIRRALECAIERLEGRSV